MLHLQQTMDEIPGGHAPTLAIRGQHNAPHALVEVHGLPSMVGDNLLFVVGATQKETPSPPYWK